MDAEELQRIWKQAFALDEKNRADLAHDLLDSIEKPLTETEREWLVEAERRLAEYDAGKTHSVPIEDVLRDIEERLL